MKKVVLIIVGFCVISILLTAIWNEWGRLAYANLLDVVGPPIYTAIGFGDAHVFSMRLRYINFVPFTALVLVTSGISHRRRFIGLALGLFVLFVSHLVLNLTAILQPGDALPVASSLISDAFPLLVWLIVAYPAVRRFSMPPTR